MANLGTIAVNGQATKHNTGQSPGTLSYNMAKLGTIVKYAQDYGPRQTLRKLSIGLQDYVPGGMSVTEGNPAQPSLRIDTLGYFRFRWSVTAGTRTLSIGVKQPINGTLRPRVSIEANSGISVTATSSTAPAGIGWVTIGPITITPSASGAVWVRLENRDLGQYTPCYWDHIVTS